MEKKILKDRLDLRIDSDLKTEFTGFCKSKKIKLSKAGREALTTYMKFKNLTDLFIMSLQDPDFYSRFNSFYNSLSNSHKKSINDILGPEEERLIESTPPQLLKNIKVITIHGQKALNKKKV